MIALNKFADYAIIQHNIPLMPIFHTHALMRNPVEQHRSLRGCAAFENTANRRVVPVLHGDAVLNSDLGFAILSGHQLRDSLIISFNAERIIMDMDTEGLFTADLQRDASASTVGYCASHELRIVEKQIPTANITELLVVR